MFADQIAAGITAARRLDQLDHIARDVWRAYGAGVRAGDQAEGLSAALESRRKALRGGEASHVRTLQRPPVSIYPPRKTQRSPDRRKSIERRRHLAASGPMPPALAARFTTGELAVLRVVADEITTRGVCSLTLGELAARAGTCRSVAQRALRAAAKAGMVVVEERRRRGQPNLPNVVRVVSREWLSWLAKRPRSGERGGGFLFRAPTVTKLESSGTKRAAASKGATLSSGGGVGERGGARFRQLRSEALGRGALDSQEPRNRPR